MGLRLLTAALVVVLGVGALGVLAVQRSTVADADVVAAIISEREAASARGDHVAPTPSPTATATSAAPTPAAAATATPLPQPAQATSALQAGTDPLLSAVWPVPGAGTATPPPTTPPTPPPATDLARRLERILAHPDLAISGDHGVAVVDRWGREVVVEGGRVPVLPASTVKLVVAAAALEMLGPQARFRTAIATTAPPDARGVVDGDLVLVGGGDPVLASPRFVEQVYPARPHTPIARLADAVAAAGITRVTGRVVADSRIVPGTSLPQGWDERDYLDRLDGTRVSGLTVDAGRRLWERESDEALLAAAAADPALQAAAVLTDLLDETDVRVDGDPAVVADSSGRGGGDAVPPSALASAEIMATVTSPPLTELLTHMVQRSDNHVADSLFRLLGALRADGTWDGSSRVVRAALADLGLDWRGVRLADGSGLSRVDRVTPLFLAHLDRAMLRTRHAGQWRALMAVAGESGTLRARYRRSPAAGTVFGKTGLLVDVRALAGSVDGPGAARFHFAVVGSELEGEEIARLRRTMDLVVYALAAEQHGCDGWQPPAVEESDGGPPPEAAVCP